MLYHCTTGTFPCAGHGPPSQFYFLIVFWTCNFNVFNSLEEPIVHFVIWGTRMHIKQDISDILLVLSFALHIQLFKLPALVVLRDLVVQGCYVCLFQCFLPLAMTTNLCPSANGNLNSVAEVSKLCNSLRQQHSNKVLSLIANYKKCYLKLWLCVRRYTLLSLVFVVWVIFTKFHCLCFAQNKLYEQPSRAEL